MAKDAQYFLDNPGKELTIDDIMASGIVSAEGDVADGVEEETLGVKEESASEEPKPVESEAPVEAADGKHTIPYNVLKNARERASEFKELYEEQIASNELLAAKLDKLTSAFQAGKNVNPDEVAKVQEQVNSAVEIDPDYYANEFGEEIGALARALQQQMERNNTLASELEGVKKFSSAVASERQNDIVSAVEEAISSVEDLVDWREKAPEAFDRAVAFDDMLKADPRYAGMPLNQRFAKAAQMTRAYYGQEEAQVESEDETVARKMAEAKGRRPAVVSLSQLKGGDRGPVTTSVEDVAESSIGDIHRKFSEMSPAAIEKYINSLG